ncbi:hypothetical protein [Vibrio breoganii]|nr:hypothetical protein [Vibrio breoganii]MDN3717028.1 hypothetical protein [Vibrio breoganii]
MRDFEVTKATDDGSLLRIDYAIALKGESPRANIIYVASRNMQVDGDASQ